VIWGQASTASVDVFNLRDQGYRIYGPDSSLPRFTGRDIALAGDMNADGLQDVLISADYGGSSVFVVWGKASSTPLYLDALGDAGFETIGPGACCELALAGDRDLNGDGRPDVLIGLPENVEPGRDTDRAAWAIFGMPPGRTVLLAPGAPGTLLYDGIPEFQRRDLSVATMDLNVDGRSDVLIGTPNEFRSGDSEYGIVRAFFSRPLPPVSMSLSPAEATNEVGQEHCLTAKLSDTASAPASGFLVRFEVTANNVVSGSARSDGEGRASFCYTGTLGGEDAIFAYADTNEDGVQESVNEPGASATKTYNPGRPATLSLSPVSAENALETTHCVTATVTDAFGNGIRDGSVHFTVSGGRAGNTASGSQPIDGGKATFCYAGPALGPSTDAITAYHDTDGDGVTDPDEPAGSAQKDWALPPSSNGCRVAGAGQARSETGRKVKFRLDVRAIAGTVSGNFRHEEHGMGKPVTIRSFRLAALSCAADGSMASVFGEGSYNGRSRLLLRVDVSDKGETSADSYRVRLSSGFDSGEVRPLSGDIAIDLPASD
jgi:hypothetical protein